MRAIFDQAVDEPADMWQQIVSRASREDASLHDEVMLLLAAASEDRYRLDHPRLVIPHTTDDQDGDEQEGEERVGSIVARYRLVRLIGRGGMGTVYESVRADEAYEQRVAIKLIRPELGTAGMASRFRRERQILAALEHRNIARLLDGGATEQGEPFLVMEYVEGTPIIEYCNERRLSIHDRLRLFLQVCAAVQHAHSKLIVHRDLKPANMLVTADGSVKLLDFGVAKLLGAQDGAPGMATQLGPRPLTPEYASPEQLRDEPVSAASDVYSLGVVLYELLAGRRPFYIATRSPVAALQAMAREAPRPSTVATLDAAQFTRESDVARLRRKLAGELDNVVRKTLRSDPARRYESVEQFANDIRRHLDGRPVLAQPDSIRYRLRKYVQRNWPGVLAASIAVVALVVGSGAALLQARRAELERAKSAQVNAFLLQMLSTLDGRRIIHGGQPHLRSTVSDMLDEAASRAGVALAADAPVESAVRNTLGRAYTAIGRYDDGVAQFTRALLVDRKGGAPALPDIATDIIALGDAQLERGDNRAADTLFRAALHVCRLNNRHADTAHVCVLALNDLGGATWFENRLAESERLYREALQEHRRVFGPTDPLTAIVMGNLGGVLDSRGDMDGAERMYRESLAAYAKANDRYLPQRAFTLTNLASNLEQRGQFAEADALVREAIDVISRSESPYQPDAGLAWVQLGAIHREAGNLALARTETARGLSILVQGGAIARRLLVKTKTREALLLLAEGKPVEARSILATALDSASAEFTPDDPRFAEVQAALGETLLALRRQDEAAALLSDSYATYLRSFGAKHPQTVAVQRELQLARASQERSRART